MTYYILMRRCEADETFDGCDEVLGMYDNLDILREHLRPLYEYGIKSCDYQYYGDCNDVYYYIKLVKDEYINVNFANDGYNWCMDSIPYNIFNDPFKTEDEILNCKDHLTEYYLVDAWKMSTGELIKELEKIEKEKGVKITFDDINIYENGEWINGDNYEWTEKEIKEFERIYQEQLKQREYETQEMEEALNYSGIDIRNL